ncbi:MAG: DUF424 domain-containing protein [Promethearchaeota archaeon]
MKVYIKLHVRNDMDCVACCDEELLKRVFKEGNLRIEITEQFYGGQLVNLEEAIEILSDASNFNIVGENIINHAISCKLLSKDGVQVINGVPMAMKMML